MGNRSIYNEIQPLSDIDCDERMCLTYVEFDDNGDDAYFTWRKNVIASLAVRNKLEFLEKQFSKSDSAISKPDLWKKSDGFVKSWILNSLSQKVKSALKDCNYAYDIWDALESKYGEPVQNKITKLQEDIAKSTESSKTKNWMVSTELKLKLEYFQVCIKSQWDELDKLEEMVGCRIPANKEQQRISESINLLCSPDDELKKKIMAKSPSTVEVVVSMVQSILHKPKSSSENQDPNYPSSSSRGCPEPTDGGERKNDISTIGLAGLHVMGQNLALNIADRGFNVCVYSKISSEVDTTVKRALKEGNLPVVGFNKEAEFVNSLPMPRVLIVVAKDGSLVDDMIYSLSVGLGPHDIIIDASNSWYDSTCRRSKSLWSRQIYYLGMGVSGSESDARRRPSLVVSGNIVAYLRVEHILLKIAGKNRENETCLEYVGLDGWGHYVNMVNNGITYAQMHIIAECYDVLKSVVKLSPKELHNFFRTWNKGELLRFYEDIFEDNSEGARYLVAKYLKDADLEEAAVWTAHQGLDLSVPAPTIGVSVGTTFLYPLKEERDGVAKFNDLVRVKEDFISNVDEALYASLLCVYAQGIELLYARETLEKNWTIVFANIIRVWKGHSVIDPRSLDVIFDAFIRDPKLSNLLLDQDFAGKMRTRHSAWKSVVCEAIQSDMSVPAMSSSLAYFSAYGSNLN